MKQITEMLVKQRETPFEQVAKLLPGWMKFDLPRKWKCIGSVLIIRIPEKLQGHAQEIAEAYSILPGISSVVKTGDISGELRQPSGVHLLYGDSTETTVIEYGISYRLDVAKQMWSAGNMGWRAGPRGPPRVKAIYDFHNPLVIMDCFAGVGYFALQMAKAYPNAKVIAIDKNPESIQYLRQNIELNSIVNIEVVNKDCRDEYRKADVIHLGYIGGTCDFLSHAFNCLEYSGKIIFHEVYRDKWLGFKKRSDWDSMPANLSKKMNEHSCAVEAFARVKAYGPSSSHIVARLKRGN